MPRSALFMFALLAPFAAEAAAPSLVPVTGYLVDADGAPVDVAVDMDLTLYINGTTTTSLWTETQTVDVDNGQFTVYLGEDTALALDTFRDNGTLFLGIAVDSGAEMTPRFELATAPFAAFAQYCEDAGTVGGIDPDDLLTATAGVDWTDVNNVPASLLDGDQDTIYTLDQAAVEGYARGVAYDSLAELQTDLDSVYLASASCGTDELLVSDGLGGWACGGVNDLPIDAALIATGVLNVARIPNLDGSKITGSLNVTNVTVTGALVAPNVPTGRVTTIRVRGTGLNQATGSQDRNIVVNGIDGAGNARGLHLTVIRRSDGSIVSNRAYDTHGDAVATASLVTDLNALNDTVVVAIASFDAWTGALSAPARDALVRVGASSLVYKLKGTCCDDFTSDSRSAYVLVGIPGRGMGTGIEAAQRSGIGPIELAAMLVDGDLVGKGYDEACPPGWYDIGSSCIEYFGAGDNQSWRQTADRCYTMRSHMCSPYEMYTAIRLYGPALDIGPGLSHPHVDQLGVGFNDSSWGERIVMQGWTTPTSSASSWLPTDANPNSRNICCTDK